MLTYFPAPYPNEWWYSVLCRYHVRSGRQDAAATLHELYGKHPLIHAKLFPGVDQYVVFKQIPEEIFSLEELILKQTLMPYYVRFASLEAKQRILNRLLSGLYKRYQVFQTKTPEGKYGLKFCPFCYAEDAKIYGEPYWHREHQIPLISVCPKHKCQLHLVEISFSELEERFLPLYEIPNDESICQSTSSLAWEPLLSDALFSILTLPFEVGPPLGYNNLENVLRSDRFESRLMGNKSTLDMERLRRYCVEFYGEAIGKQYFLSMKNFRWNSSLPERYALLSVIAGITIEELFGPEIQSTDPLLKKLLEYKDMDIGKDELAKQMGLSKDQIDILVKK